MRRAKNVLVWSHELHSHRWKLQEWDRDVGGQIENSIFLAIALGFYLAH